MFEDLLDDDETAMDAYEPDEMPLPRNNTQFFGHEDIEPYMLNLINGGKMPHALILSGPQGVGKATFAYRMARALLKHGITDPNQDSLFGDAPAELNSFDVENDDPIFRKISSGGHPDFLALERPMDERKGAQKGSIDIGTARKVAPFLRMTSSEGGWRIVIIDDADTMNRNAQNAILKVLEEPPANTVLMLVCHRIGALIPTIRSRCRLLSFEPLEDDIIITALQKQLPHETATNLKIAAHFAEGSLGKAFTFMDEDGLSTINSAIDILVDWQNWDWVRIHTLADNLGRIGQDSTYQNFTGSLLWMMESLCFAKAKGQINLPVPLDHQALQNMLSHYSLEEWVKICENLKAHFETFEKANLDKRQAILGAFGFIQ